MIRREPAAEIESQFRFEDLTDGCQLNALVVPVGEVVLEEDGELRLLELWPHIASDPPLATH
jgi:hypothetical protein